MTKLIIAILTLTACHSADVGKARREAQQFAEQIPGSTSVLCNDSDSDGDGYVSCTVFRGEKEPLAIQCDAEELRGLTETVQ